MHGINGVSPTGIESKPQQRVDGSPPVSNPINTAPSPVDTALSADMRGGVPLCDKSLAIDPVLPSELLDANDLKRYNETVRQEFAEYLSRIFKAPVESIMARLPEVKLGDAKEMTIDFAASAGFFPENNVIKLNPVKEIFFMHGKGEPIVIHELTHGFLSNARRNEAMQTAGEEFNKKMAISVIDKMLNGEHGQIIKEFRRKEINGQLISEPIMMDVPPLSAKERELIFQVVKNKYLEPASGPNSAKLNDAGKEFVRKTLLPQLDEYSKSFNGISEAEDKACSNIIDYINSFFVRKDLLISSLTASEYADLEKNLKIPLSNSERIMTENSIEGFLSTQEGNMLLKSQFSSDHSMKSYFMSYEEQLARRFENKYRLKKINEQIKNFEKQGFRPTKSLLEEKQAVKNNIKLLRLTKKLGAVEQQIISAPKDYARLNQIEKLREELDIAMGNMSNFEDIIKQTKEGNIFKKIYLTAKTEEETLKLLKESLSPELHGKFNEYVEFLTKIGQLTQGIETLNAPEKLLADTAENHVLKTQFDNILGEIKKTTKNCDLHGTPQSFFETVEDLIKTNGKKGEIMSKWAKKLAKVRI